MIALDQYTIPLTSIGANPLQQLYFPRGGTCIRCTAADDEFDLSIEGSPKIRFGIGRSIEAKNPDGSQRRFENFEIYRRTDGGLDTNNVTLIVGTVNIQDGRLGLFPNQTVRVTGAAKLLSNNFVLTGGNDAISEIGTGSFITNVRNLSATNPVRLISSAVNADINTLTAGRGYYLGPGENVDLPVDSYYLRARGTVGDTLVVSGFFYS